ncbi:PREDICTED: putative methyltransferase C9orf114 homolog [Amphimedon queenslandica]|uniref:Uncharacterized protein n=1 Tax=Amphimedon queenslandica TaxID=400682 RepID=A0A1X7UNY0_AMPQE|nr:PREDICTED: putative methyltransferase C9orf114 homolog [Amphimedon queenslandica]|eukprot:XP_019853232.1 PREDICTED: putative methyltransferase C9orf114 homolog [Amphimedon queenslandica]
MESETDHKEGGQSYTVSIALPGSILNNVQSFQLKTYLAGQIARIAAIFCVNEIVIFKEEGTDTRKGSETDPDVFMCRILQYMETPQYLRKALYGMHPDLKYAGVLNPLDAPHHMRAHEDSPFREGIVLSSTDDGSSMVDCGLNNNVTVNKKLETGVRVTVKMKKRSESGNNLRGKIVAPSIPLTSKGIYWGYQVRYARSFGEVFTSSSYKESYDVIIGTSERGDPIDSVLPFPQYKHLLIVFGGQHGLEYSLEKDRTLEVDDVRSLFHFYLNTCTHQGSRTIRTEEAITISLSALKGHIIPSK